MGWGTGYKLHLSQPIKNYDGNYIETKCKEEICESIEGIYYMCYQYRDENIIYVFIKYGKYEIIDIAEFINKIYNIGIKIEVYDPPDPANFDDCDYINKINIGNFKKTDTY